MVSIILTKKTKHCMRPHINRKRWLKQATRELYEALFYVLRLCHGRGHSHSRLWQWFDLGFENEWQFVVPMVQFIILCETDMWKYSGKFSRNFSDLIILLTKLLIKFLTRQNLSTHYQKFRKKIAFRCHSCDFLHSDGNSGRETRVT